jgi:hypothetical protein
LQRKKKKKGHTSAGGRTHTRGSISDENGTGLHAYDDHETNPTFSLSLSPFFHDVFFREAFSGEKDARISAEFAVRPEEHRHHHHLLLSYVTGGGRGRTNRILLGVWVFLFFVFSGGNGVLVISGWMDGMGWDALLPSFCLLFVCLFGFLVVEFSVARASPSSEPAWPERSQRG